MLPSQISDKLNNILGERAVYNYETRVNYSQLFTYHHSDVPDVIVFPKTKEEVSNLVKICNDEKIPIVTYGAGTSFEGQISMSKDNICLSLELMNNIIEVHESDHDIVVEAGIRRSKLDMYLDDTPFFFPAGPGVDATIGGMISTRASGINAVRYGTIRENVLSLNVVLPDGSIINTGSRARKSSAGYDLTHLFTGAEGTLGIICNATLKLHPKPEAKGVAIVSFNTLHDAVNASVSIIQRNIPVSCIELLDEQMVKAVNQFSSTSYPNFPCLFIEVHADEYSINLHMSKIETVAKQFGALSILHAYEIEARNKLWKARIDAAPSILALRPGSDIMSTDVCVPVSKLAACIEKAQEAIALSGLIAPIIGHVGDGNFHAGILVDTGNENEMKKAKDLNKKIVGFALEMEGTCSGEHGIGIGKLQYMTQQHGEALKLMQAIKKSIDPFNIMNPGKLIA